MKLRPKYMTMCVVILDVNCMWISVHTTSNCIRYLPHFTTFGSHGSLPDITGLCCLFCRTTDIIYDAHISFVKKVDKYLPKHSRRNPHVRNYEFYKDNRRHIKALTLEVQVIRLGEDSRKYFSLYKHQSTNYLEEKFVLLIDLGSFHSYTFHASCIMTFFH